VAQWAGHWCILHYLIFILFPLCEPVGILFRAFVRYQIRGAKNIGGSFLGDLCAHLCCDLCALCQEARETDAV